MTTEVNATRRHGERNTYAAGCRCVACRRANSAYMLAAVHARAARRVEVDGQLVAVEAPRHGVASTYKNWMCHCPPCRDAYAAEQRRRYQRRRAAGNVGRRTRDEKEDR